MNETNALVRSRSGRATPALLVSAGVHAGAAALALAAPAHWLAAVGVIAANHVVLTAAGLWPRSRLLGPNLLRLPPQAASRREVSLTLQEPWTDTSDHAQLRVTGPRNVRSNSEPTE